MKNVAIKELRPTQMTHGEREVAKKADDYRHLSGHDLEMAIAEKPVPIVLGPAGRPYIIDHHHVAAALRLVGVSDVPVVLVEDLSSLETEEFWFTMENRRWAYPYDVRGQRRPFAEMPRHVWQLADDVCRSLAAFAREAGAYGRTSTPLEDFRWADFFRSMLPLPTGDEEFQKVLKQAIALAKTDAAVGLPGYIGRSQPA
ncbi:ParB/Srx family N-terminal domain-containing protein [Paraburkholderia strydomiana]|uniref:ParB-like protein n=1 Tax=Paraburkholderia strydomiana TaxID=1245417 RepID=UPI0038B90D0F